MNVKSIVIGALAVLSLSSSAEVVVETKAFRLTLGDDAVAESLVVKETDEEMLDPHERLPLFATTQIRPFNNEIRLVQQSKRTTYPANRVHRVGNLLHVGFETAPYEVVVSVEETAAGYAVFRPVKLVSDTEQEKQYYNWNMDVPPVESFRLLQLPVRDRSNFGDWLNVMWDEKGYVAAIGGTPYMDVDAERRHGFRKMTVESLKDYGVTNGVAVLAAAGSRIGLLDQIGAAEVALGMPRGVDSRRDSRLNASLFWTNDFRPETVDEILGYAKKGGFRMLLIHYTSLVKAKNYATLPDYSWDHGWTAGKFSEALKKVHAAGISAGLHTLQTFIGLESEYVTPEADHRLALVKRFTLAQPLGVNATASDLIVEECPVAAPMHPKCRVLRFGTELFTYEGYETTRPFRFTGVRRRHLGTYAKDHPRGEIGGVLGISECQAKSCYIDQDSSLQDEVGERIAKIFDCGLDFVYFDGSEDVNPPCSVNISLSQLKVVQEFAKQPLFTEGCAKSHFGWHLQSGANAFDTFAPEIFKRKIVEYPCAAAVRLARDFTRVDFGWWWFGPPELNGTEPKAEGLWKEGVRTVGVQPDIWEYGTSKAAAYDCPATMQMRLCFLRAHKRTDDILETVRKWEDIRVRGLLTAADKEKLKDPNREYHLVDDGKGGYDIVEWKQLDVAGGKWTPVRAFLYERNGRRVVAYWHVSGRANLVIANGGPSLLAENMQLWESDLSEESLRDKFLHARIVEDERR